MAFARLAAVPGISLRFPLVRQAIPAIRFRGAFVALAVLAFGMWQGPLKLVGVGFTHLPGDPIDNRFNHYVLEHGYRYLTGGVKHFWHAKFFYPARLTIAGSDNHIGTLPIYAAARKVGCDPEDAFQVWFLVLSLANFGSGYLAFRVVGVRPVGAACGAYLYAFGLPVIGQAGHVQLTARCFAPIAAACGWRFLWNPRVGWAAGLAWAAAGQIFANMYIGIFLAAMLFAGFVATTLLCRRELPWRELLRTGWPSRLAVAAVPIAAVVALTLPYVKMSRMHPPVPKDMLLSLTPDSFAWLRAPYESATWNDIREYLPRALPFECEKTLFPGAVGLLAATIGVGFLARFIRNGGDRTTALAAVCAVIVLPMPLMFIEIDGHSIFRGLLHVPGLAKLRASGRVVLVLLIPLGVLLGFAVDAAMRLPRSRSMSGLVALIAVSLLFFDQRTLPLDDSGWDISRYPAAESRGRRIAWTKAFAAEPGAKLIYVFPRREADLSKVFETQLDAMWGGLETGVPVANGYTGYLPTDWSPFRNYCDLFHWFRLREVLTSDLLNGLVTFGEPWGDDARPEELQFRVRFTSRPSPVMQR